MMKELRRFIVREDAEMGVTGFVPEGAPLHFNSATEGGIIAHDALEHIKGDTSWTGELIALGHMLYIRGCGDYWGSFKQAYTTEVYKHLASDFLAFLPTEGWSVPAPGRTTRIDDEAEEMIEQTVEELLRMVPLEFDSEDRPGQMELARCLANARGWLRKGYRMAQKRFHGASPWQVCNLFAKIERDAEGCTKSPEFYHVLEVRYDTKTLEYSVRLREMEYEY